MPKLLVNAAILRKINPCIECSTFLVFEMQIAYISALYVHLNHTHVKASYHIAQNFGGRTLWWIAAQLHFRRKMADGYFAEQTARINIVSG